MTRKHISLSHNDFFQKIFQRKEVAESFFKAHLPKELIEDADWVSLRLAPSEFVGRALRNRRSDILYEVRIDGRNSFFFIHLEHQRTPQQDMVTRMLYYTTDIWQQYEEQHPHNPDLPLIYPMVIYQGKKRWDAPLRVHEHLKVPEYFRSYCPQMEYHLLDLSAYSDEEIQGDILQRLMLLVMQNIDSETITELLFDKYFPLFSELLQKKRGVEYIEDMLYYLSYKSKHLRKDEVVKKLTQDPKNNELKEVVMTLAEQWKQEGIEQGIERGIEQGIERGKIGVVSRQLTIRFRDDAQVWIKKLNSLSSKDLNTVSERILTANSISEVFMDLV